MQQKLAITATVTGNDQHVGFRAMVMKQAIAYNLAGVARNDANDIVRFTLQGDADRIGEAVAAIREGTKKSSGIEVSTGSCRRRSGLEHIYDRRLDVDKPQDIDPVHARLQAERRRQRHYRDGCQGRLARHSEIDPQGRRFEETRRERLRSRSLRDAEVREKSLLAPDVRLGPQAGGRSETGMAEG